MSDAVRRLIASIVATGAPTEVLDDASRQIDTVAASLQPYAARSRYDDTTGLTITRGSTAVFEHHPFLGPSNPMAPPVRIERGDEQVTARLTFDLRHEGMPGYAHGGWIAAVFDQVLAVAAASLAGRPAMTGTMTIRFIRPTPIDTPLSYVATAETTGARTVRVISELFAGTEVTARGEGIMVQSKTPRIGLPGGDE
ncbi:MAG TPA: PaaI family thioesterase [Acidimicrobiia bacterium]|nr:PaaI family thioesterase [Acidimicrobiia bacterium]